MTGYEPEALMADRHVAHWLEELRRQQGDDPSAGDSRLAVLARFCRYVERTPGEMIDDVLNFDEGRIRFKGRRFYAAKIEEFESDLEGDAYARRDAANVVRSFFIHNGLFLGTPKAPWLA